MTLNSRSEVGLWAHAAGVTSGWCWLNIVLNQHCQRNSSKVCIDQKFLRILMLFHAYAALAFIVLYGVVSACSVFIMSIRLETAVLLHFYFFSVHNSFAYFKFASRLYAHRFFREGICPFRSKFFLQD